MFFHLLILSVYLLGLSEVFQHLLSPKLGYSLTLPTTAAPTMTTDSDESTIYLYFSLNQEFSSDLLNSSSDAYRTLESDVVIIVSLLSVVTVGNTVIPVP